MKAIDYIKELSNIPNEFIDDLFSFYDESTLQTDFVINLNVVAKWLDVRKDTLLDTLRNTYKHRIDYIITKDKNPKQKDPRNNNYKHVLITPDCFKRLSMLSRSKKAETVRSYFIDIENTFIKYRQQTLDGIKKDIQNIQRKNNKKYDPHTGYVYVIRVSKEKNLYKPGSTTDMNKRLLTYETGKEAPMEVVYMYKTDHIRQVEGCVKAWLKGTQYNHNKEIYEVDLSILKKLINSCGDIGLKLHHKAKIVQPDDQKGGYFIVLKNDSN